MRICTVVGARPQFIKASVVSRAFRQFGLRETLVHTGQHYDHALSEVFFAELDIPQPSVNLEVGSGPHGRQTGTMMERLEAYLLGNTCFDALLVYGDTNSTLAGALVAAKLGIPIAHIEAGLRSFNREMPEEINRIVTDHLSRWLFCPTDNASRNLLNEGLTCGVHICGDVMLDATRAFAGRAATAYPLSALTTLDSRSFLLATVHRAQNTDDRSRLAAVLEGLGRLDWPVILPMHPRTRAKMRGIEVPSNLLLVEPVGYLAMLTLIRHAHRVITDSGGLQKESYWLGVPCITLRKETEWPETLVDGWNVCVDCDADALVKAVNTKPVRGPGTFGQVHDNAASEYIARALLASSDE